jgi:hypothetical protein
MVIRRWNLILLMSTGVIPAGVVIVYTNKMLTPTGIITPVRVSEVL